MQHMVLQHDAHLLVPVIRFKQIQVLPVPTGVLNHNVMVLIDATHCACGGEGLEHAVSPPPVAVLEGLNNLKIQINVDQVAYLKTTRISVAILLTWEIKVTLDISIKELHCKAFCTENRRVCDLKQNCRVTFDVLHYYCIHRKH